MKYTKEVLEEVIKDANSISDVIRHFGLKPESGGPHRHFKKLIEKYNIDCTHFQTYKAVPPNKRLSSKEILSNNRINRRENIKALRRALIEFGIEYKCSECFTTDIWNNKPISLQIDHVNGNSLDNRVENLRFLCPNCHSQTDNYGNKKPKIKCLDCDELIKCSKTRCKKCSDINRAFSFRKVERPTKELLQKLIWEKPATHIAKDYNVSDRTISDWCKDYQIIKPPKGYWSGK